MKIEELVLRESVCGYRFKLRTGPSCVIFTPVCPARTEPSEFVLTPVEAVVLAAALLDFAVLQRAINEAYEDELADA